MHGFFLGLSRLMAILGGIVLSALVILTSASIIGRELAFLNIGFGAISGDFEIIEAGIAFAIFAFLPLCQITAGHATVDVFASFLPAGVQRWLRAATEVLFAAVLILIAVQLYEGMLSKLRSGQTTLHLQFPVWWAYALSVVGAVLAAIVGVWMALVRIREAATGVTIVPEEGTEH